MKLTTSFLLIVAIGVLASCNGYQNVTPPAQLSQTSAPATALLHLLPPGISPRSGATCTAPTYKLKAGPFIIFVANGKVKKGTFKSQASPLTLWEVLKIKKSTKPVPSPSSSPTSPPMDQPEYFYFGEYTLAKAKQTGCAFLITTQSGKPFTGSKFSGLAFGAPSIAYPKYYKEKVIASGPVTVKLSKLSATGGNGTATLKLQNGTTYDTATVKLTYRLAPP